MRRSRRVHDQDSNYIVTRAIVAWLSLLTTVPGATFSSEQLEKDGK